MPAMFIRSRRGYQEALESYRHPGTGKPTHCCIARWSSGKSLNDEIAKLEQAYATTLALLRRVPDTLGKDEIYFYLGAHQHQLRLRRRLESLWRAHDGMTRAAYRHPKGPVSS
jgi:hypothetical protein